MQIGDSLSVKVEVTNTGIYWGEEVVQLYLSLKEIAPETPLCQLAGFKKVGLKPKESRIVEFKLSTRDLAYVDETGGVETVPGNVLLYVGNVCPSAPERFTSQVLSRRITLKGEPEYFMY